MPSRGPIAVTVAITSARRPAASPATPRCFLDLHEGFGALSALAPPGRLPLQLGDPLVARIRHPRHRAALLRRPGQRSPIARRAPRRQVRGVQPLPTEQRADRPGRLTAVRLPDDLSLVLERELPPCRLRRHLDLRSTEGSFQYAHRPPILARPRH